MNKYLLCVLVMAVFATAAWGEECRLMLVISHGSTGLISPTTLTDATNRLHIQAGLTNPNGHAYGRDGWGLAYYLHNNTETTDGLIWTGPNTTITGPRYADYNSCASGTGYTHYQQALATINPTTAHSHIVIGHVRLASNPGTNYDPHPFVYEVDGHSYCFAFNGTVPGSMKQSMADDATSIITSNGWGDTQLLALLGSTNDSSVYCGYLLTYIRLHNWNVLQGLHAAMTQLLYNPDPPLDWSHNFVFTDGYDAYAYHYDDSTQDHPLGYCMTTAGGYETAVIMSSFKQSSNSEPSFANEVANSRVALDNDDLVYIPYTGNVVRFKQFTQSTIDWMKTFPSIAGGTTRYVWSWDSFPVLTCANNNAIPTLTTGYGTGYGFDTADTLRAYPDHGQYFLYQRAGTWQSHLLPTLGQTTGYKTFLIADDPTPPRIRGTLIPENSTVTLQPGIGNWVGYWLLNSQSLLQALGSNISKIASVQAQDWSYTYNPIGAQTEDQPMEFGKMYIITLKSSVTVPTTFQWTNSREPQSQIVVAAAQNLTVQANSATYEAIDVASVADTTGIREIGVYAGDTCLGASKVISYPVQIIAYTEGYEGEDLTFRYYTGQRSAVQGEAVSSIYDTQSDAYESGALTARPGAYRVVTLGANELTPAAVPTPALHVSAAPNPFNPSTVISLSLPKDAPVEVSIYNLRGQRVCQLAKGQYTAGTYRFTWNGISDNGHATASGIYFCRVQAGSSVATCKMIMMK